MTIGSGKGGLETGNRRVSPIGLKGEGLPKAQVVHRGRRLNQCRLDEWFKGLDFADELGEIYRTKPQIFLFRNPGQGRNHQT